MKIIIAGSRTITNYQFIVNIVLDIIYMEWRLNSSNITEIISGHARGVDKIGEKLAKKMNKKLKIFKANWWEYGKKAGYLRNVEMANHADALIAIWDGKSKGTKMMIDIAKKKGLKVYVYQINKTKEL